MFIPSGHSVELPKGSTYAYGSDAWELWHNRLYMQSYLVRKVNGGYMVTTLPGIQSVTRNARLFSGYTTQRLNTACGSCG